MASPPGAPDRADRRGPEAPHDAGDERLGISLPVDVAVVASDLDGTLLAPPGSVPRPDGGADHLAFGMASERTHRALDRLRERDVEIIAVTGRPPRWVAGLGLGSGLAVCSNGALVVDLSSGAVVTERTIDPDIAAEVVARLRAVYPDAVMAVEFADGVGLEPGWAGKVPRAAAVGVAPAEELVLRPPAKILARVAGHRGDGFIDRGVDAIGGIAEVTASGGLELIEISALGVDKAETLSELCTGQGVAAARVVAFGDARNDVGMLRWAGIGVAMGDAPDVVRAAADDVTGTNAEDGVAAWLERHVLSPVP